MTQTHDPELSPRKLIAPIRHTGLVLLLILGITLLGAYSQRSASATAAVPPGGRAILYLSLIALQYGLLQLIRGGLKRYGHKLREIIGVNDNSARAVVGDLLVAALFWIVSLGVLQLIRFALRGSDNQLSGLLPQGLEESVLWIMVSIAAGFCEEILYRGYLQRQFLALSGSVTIAVLAQAILFGISHSYQGIKPMIAITAYGAMFGILAQWRGSLRPGMMAHAWTDIVGGLLRF